MLLALVPGLLSNQKPRICHTLMGGTQFGGQCTIAQLHGLNFSWHTRSGWLQAVIIQCPETPAGHMPSMWSTTRTYMHLYNLYASMCPLTTRLAARTHTQQAAQAAGSAGSTCLAPPTVNNRCLHDGVHAVHGGRGKGAYKDDW